MLDWSLATSESQAEWEALLIGLDTRGLYRQRGLELIVHDGGSELGAALQQVYPHIPHQRCLFHKLRNLRQSIVPPPQLSRRQRQTFKADLMRQVRPLFEAQTLQQAQHMTTDLCSRLQNLQPRLAALLLQDWADNFAFLHVLQRFPIWQRRFLRITSLLERVNRMIRRLFRAAGAFHSQSGLLATAARVLMPFRLI